MMTIDELKEICKLTVELTRLRQNECKHLAVENVGPEIFHTLLSRFAIQKQGVTTIRATETDEIMNKMKWNWDL